MENLDAMSATELLEFCNRHQSGRKYRDLGLAGRGAKTIAGNLSCYAANKATAMQCRLRGDIPTAMMYEGIADRIYNRLPESARW